jgi:HD-GYP domain-containing protein (c-di-GMP phosphodiesterase class II)
MSLALGRSVGITEYEKDVLRVVGPIHDLGKIGIPDAVLLKPGKLTPDEYDLMQGHSIYGEEIMNRFEILSNEARIIRHHHERYDGKGYPDALAVDDIPKCSRIIAVCDTFDAMTSNRPYRNAMAAGQALAEIERCKGLQFDPGFADAFIKLVETGDHETC